MNVMNRLVSYTSRRLVRVTVIPTLILVMLLGAVAIISADIPTRVGVRGTVPNPGTQQQELANITFPAPYNVFEFVVTCAGCHGGGIDQQAGHFGNWAGTSMASAARDPIFRANQIAVNNIIQSLTGENGAGNMCFRCHSPNGWYSGRFDPTLAGDPAGSTMEHSILISTDDEGIMCEVCHRTIGNVAFERDDLDANDPVWNMMAGISDWPHQGGPYVDQANDPTIAVGNPYGDTTLKINDGMTYVGKYSGSVDVYASDLPMQENPPGSGTWIQGGYYTGQTYGVYPPSWTGPRNPVPPGLPKFDPAGQEIAYNPDGSVPIHFEAPIGPPIDPATGTYDYMAQALSLEHPTAGDRPGLLPMPVPDADNFIRSSEFCGTCHDLTVPILDHGMPEQRTYTEWKFSDFGASNVRCQECHMPSILHEYADDAPLTLNPDPVISGWFPYAKDRASQGGTAFHKFAGANRDLPMMMTELYPEVDLEVIGAVTGNDTRIFPGMLSNRDPMWERTQRNTEISLLDGVDAEIVNGPIYDAGTGRWTVQVRVTNNAGHRIPSGYPDGRRFWIELQVTDSSGTPVYESGHYDHTSATLFTDSTNTGFQRALEPNIDAADNAVMVYERVIGQCIDADNNGTPESCTASPSLLNDYVLFDNRILAAGFDYAQLRQAGVKFWNYNSATMVPYEDLDRFPAGQNWDLVTYSFDAPADAVLSARAEVYWQTHTREFMEHLKTQDTSTLRPEGPPSIFEVNYPLVPNYLSDVIGLDTIQDMDGNPLNDNWGGIAYAAWMLTGRGAPYLVAGDDTSIGAPPAAPANVTTLLSDPFTVQVNWDPVPDAEGYLVWIRYGASDSTADWDRLAVVYDGTQLVNTAMNVGKTYAVRVQAFNGEGFGPNSVVVSFTTPTDLPLPPENLQVFDSTPTSISLSWFDVADNEVGFVIERQDVPVVGNFYPVADIPSQTAGPGSGGNNWTDTSVQSSRCYNYRVAAYNAFGLSAWNVNGPVQGCTQGVPGAPTNLVATVVSAYQIDLTWTAATGDVQGYLVERSTDGGITWPVVFNVTNPAATGYSDTVVQPATTYWYRVFAYNIAGSSTASNVASATTPAEPPAAPTSLVATADGPRQVTLTWTDNASNETGFIVERATDTGGPLVFAEIARVGSNIITYVDNTVEPKFAYVYRVAAFNDTGTSTYSNESRVVTPGEPPQAPENLRVSTRLRTSLVLRWDDRSNNETGFYMERSADDGITWTRIATLPANLTIYKDTGLARFTTYWYRIQAYNADGVSEYSNVAVGTTR